MYLFLFYNTWWLHLIRGFIDHISYILRVTYRPHQLSNSHNYRWKLLISHSISEYCEGWWNFCHNIIYLWYSRNTYVNLVVSCRSLLINMMKTKMKVIIQNLNLTHNGMMCKIIDIISKCCLSRQGLIDILMALPSKDI